MQLLVVKRVVYFWVLTSFIRSAWRLWAEFLELVRQLIFWRCYQFQIILKWQWLLFKINLFLNKCYQSSIDLTQFWTPRLNNGETEYPNLLPVKALDAFTHSKLEKVKFLFWSTDGFLRFWIVSANSW
jgi:hypothetical protein